MNKDFDWNRLYASLPLQNLLSELSPQDKGTYYLLKCPACAHHEAFLYKDNPSLIICNRKKKCGEETKLWDYIRNREHHETGRQTLEYLCTYAGITPPPVAAKQPQENPEEAEHGGVLREHFWHMCHESFPDSTSEEYAESRGIAQTHRLGHFPGYTETLAQLRGMGYSAGEIEEAIEFIKARDKYPLIFPVRDKNRKIISFVGRRIDGVDKAKYLPFLSYNKDSFFNLPDALDKSSTEFVVVEGYLDALVLDAEDIPVVAAASNNIPRKNLEGAMEAGVRRFILALDTDEAGKAGTVKGISAIQSMGGEVLVIPAFGGYKDPAEWVAKAGSEPFKEALKKAIPGWQFLLDHLVGSPETTVGLKGAIEKSLEIYASISSPAERELANPIFAEKLGISQEAFLAERQKQLQDDARAIAKDNSLNWEQRNTQLLDTLGYRVRLNELGKRVEVNGEVMDDFLFSNIYVSMKNAGSVGKEDLHMLIMHIANKNKYNPLKEYFEGLPPAPGGAIRKFCSYISSEDNIYFEGIFRKFLIAAVKKVHEDIEPPMLVLSGGQGIGKSKLTSWLCPDKKYFYSGPIRPRETDDKIMTGKAFIWEVAELASTTSRADRDELKYFITMPSVDVRKPYGRESMDIKPISSFIGTVNDFTGFLDDPTGSRRFHVIELHHINFAYSKDMTPEELWAEAYQAYRAGESYLLTPEEEQTRLRINKNAEVRGLVEDIIAEFVVQTNDGDFVTSRELFELVTSKGYRGNNKKAYEEIKKAMVNAGFHEGRKNNVRGYGRCRIRKEAWNPRY